MRRENEAAGPGGPQAGAPAGSGAPSTGAFQGDEAFERGRPRRAAAEGVTGEAPPRRPDPASAATAEANPAPAPAPVGRKGGFDWGLAVVLALSLGAAAVVTWRDGPRAALDVVRSDSWLFVEILPKVLAGCLIGAFVRLLVPRAVILKWLGAESGLRGLAIATLAGALMPGGPFTVFPLAAAMLAMGADRGATTAFVTAWLLIGVNRAIVWEMPFFGVGFTGPRMALALPLPLLAGWLARLVPEPPGPAPGTDGAAPETAGR